MSESLTLLAAQRGFEHKMEEVKTKICLVIVKSGFEFAFETTGFMNRESQFPQFLPLCTHNPFQKFP